LQLLLVLASFVGQRQSVSNPRRGRRRVGWNEVGTAPTAKLGYVPAQPERPARHLLIRGMVVTATVRLIWRHQPIFSPLPDGPTVCRQRAIQPGICLPVEAIARMTPPGRRPVARPALLLTI